MYCYMLFLTATAASYLVETDVPTIKPRGNLTEFLNGVVTNITHILEDIEDANETLQVQEADQVFAAADSAIKTDTREMNFRSIFSRSRGNEFINSRDVAAAAITGVNQLARLVASVGLNTTNSFDADGNPIDPGVMAVSQMRPMTCPFDLPK
ncbi:hypothetical protein EB796_020161 [Bugula neritina]|uniref:Uncharacterized protein n=1 Tax=Bugula neritina TaxID=10212 RepID=A0A7J7J6I0_BUGNE|nr:hypothetical protein EB796_020161 [Bugula neritina]